MFTRENETMEFLWSQVCLDTCAKNMRRLIRKRQQERQLQEQWKGRNGEKAKLLCLIFFEEGWERREFPVKTVKNCSFLLHSYQILGVFYNFYELCWTSKHCFSTGCKIIVEKFHYNSTKSCFENVHEGVDVFTPTSTSMDVYETFCTIASFRFHDCLGLSPLLRQHLMRTGSTFCLSLDEFFARILIPSRRTRRTLRDEREKECGKMWPPPQPQTSIFVHKTFM